MMQALIVVAISDHEDFKGRAGFVYSHPMRDWTDTNGRSFRAKFIEASRSKVVLQLENGRERFYSKLAFIDEGIASIENMLVTVIDPQSLCVYKLTPTPGPGRLKRW